MASKTMQLVEERAGNIIRASARDLKTYLPVPESFLAALTGNESVGVKDAGRHERGVLERLRLVLLGQRNSYNGVMAGMLMLPGGDGEGHHEYYKAQEAHLYQAATSWGFTQIMGYHVLRWGGNMADLVDPEKHYGFTLRLLKEITEQWGLDPSKDFEKMGRCWNTGKPDGATYHESYIPNLLRRMTEWGQIPHNEG